MAFLLLLQFYPFFVKSLLLAQWKTYSRFWTLCSSHNVEITRLSAVTYGAEVWDAVLRWRLARHWSWCRACKKYNNNHSKFNVILFCFRS
jgi:hypothetical protein